MRTAEEVLSNMGPIKDPDKEHLTRMSEKVAFLQFSAFFRTGNLVVLLPLKTSYLCLIISHRVGSRVDAIIQRLSVEIQSECQRRGAWALLGDVTGARLCTIDGELLSPEYLFHGDGTIRADDIISQDAQTGLLIPNPQTANMLLSDNVTNVPVPANFFIHQHSGRVMPIEGNVAYDPLASRLTITADSTNADAATAAEVLIPFIPYPSNPETGLPVKTTLTPVEKRGDMRLNGRMICGQTGLPVPILGMTIHSETGMIWKMLLFITVIRIRIAGKKSSSSNMSRTYDLAISSTTELQESRDT